MTQSSTHSPNRPLPKGQQNLSFLLSVLSVGLVILFLCAGLLIEQGFSESEAISIFAGAMLLVASVMTVIFKKLRRKEEALTVDYLNLGIQRYVLGLFMVKYGVPKLFGHFFDYQLSALDTPMGSVSDFELAWYFYGLNPWHELFAGIMEFVPGLLLFHRRTYYLGALLLIPVVGQVFILNLFFAIGGLTFPVSIVLLMCNLSILASKQVQILNFIRTLNFDVTLTTSQWLLRIVATGRWTAVALCALILIPPTIGAFSKGERDRQYAKLVGTYSLGQVTKSGVTIDPGVDPRYYKDLYIERQSRFNMLRRFNNETDAFIWQFSDDSNGFALKINDGGMGDNPDKIVEESALVGTYQLKGDQLILKGTQYDESLEITYKKRTPRAKKWFW